MVPSASKTRVGVQRLDVGVDLGLEAEALDPTGGFGVLAERGLADTIGEPPAGRDGRGRGAPQPLDSRERAFVDRAPGIGATPFERGNVVEQGLRPGGNRDVLARTARWHGASVNRCGRVRAPTGKALYTAAESLKERWPSG